MTNIRWGYAINQWRNTEVDLVRLDQMEMAFKVISVSGFNGIEITDSALGGGTIPAYFGSHVKFLEFLRSCGVQSVASYFSGLNHGNPTKRGDHDRMAAGASSAVETLVALGGSRLVVRAMGPYWKEAPITDDKIKLVAELWNRIGGIAKSSGVAASMHIDFLCGLRQEEHMEKLLQWTDPEAVGLTLDTAELTISGLDPVAVYRKHHTRINHVHLKDAVTTDTLDEYKNENAEMEYWPVNLVMAGVKRDVSRWYYEMGTPSGLVNFPALLTAMDEHGYDGWAIVESDQSPHVEESVMLNGWYRKQLLNMARK